ncbi:sialidase family protein [Lacihabitans soyangensis]|uniref:Exo-alpha-sialidase n=1 Tax=Lacihabitans soyangensis TaxID=869394 RepID=A0AAE3GYJ3_9BACT|nr:exo-alpha-sialidase [Lacihabitans soyangensis]MCP9761582.1 exo-alpha-sialidase [Lacihabitans soyangensis]
MKLARPKIFYFVLFSIQTFAQKSPILHSSLVFPLQEKHVHASSLVVLPNEDNLIVWFEGSGERTSDDVKLMGARLAKGQDKWSEPFLMADTPNIPDCNPVMFLNTKNQLFLVWIAVQANRWEQSILRFRTSSNYLNPGPPIWEWQDNILLKPDESFAKEVEKKLKELPASDNGWAGYAAKYDDMIIEASKDPAKRSFGWMTRIKPMVFKNGKIILPLYSDGFNMSLMAISENDGKTWRAGSPLVGRGPIQPALGKKKNGNLMALLRDSGDEPSRVQKSESIDGGETWSVATKTKLPNTASVELLTFQDGRWIFVGNDIDDGRYKLSLYVSKDEGETWEHSLYLENDSTKKMSFSYPSLLQAPNGNILVSYSYHLAKDSKSINVVEIDPGLLK